MQNSTASKLHITDGNGEVKSQIWPLTTKKKVRRKRNRRKSDKGKGGGGGDAESGREDDKISGTRGGQMDCNVHNNYATCTTER